MNYQSWAHLYRDTFAPVLLIKVSEKGDTFCESIGINFRVPEHHILGFCKLLQYRYIGQGIVFRA